MGRHALTAPQRSYARRVLPDWLLWLLPVPTATLAAVAWVAWRTRSPRPQDPADTVRAQERFRAAMAAPLPSPADRRERRRRTGS